MPHAERLRTPRHGLRAVFASLANRASRLTASAPAFAAALGVVVMWMVTGPLFGFSDTWQLAINTGTTIVTFLMVFLLQHAQNKDTLALQLKLNELIAATEGASNRLIDIEELTDEELDALRVKFEHLAQRAERLRKGARTTVDDEPGRPPPPRPAR
ncbi:MAG TPA: low affinity iron permease family protein [Candidatus Thermoplasmatota archaeon]|jgi:low affinity Fe/Cu permease|nr:low affinity iron permease family protein [Candidatus Thermoplasmatota archaeon]